MENLNKKKFKSVLSDDNIRNRINKLAKAQNINKWDLGASSSNDVSAQVYKGEAKQLKASQRSSITIRVWNKDNLIGITSTSDLSDAGLNRALESANEASKYANKEETPEFSSLAKSKVSEMNRPIKKLQGIKFLYTKLIQAEKELLNKHASIIDVPYNGFSEVEYERLYINSEGAYRYLNNTHSSLYLYAKAQEINRKPRSSGSIKLAYGSSDIDIQSCIDEAAIKTTKHLDYQPIKTDKYLVCMMPEAFLDLIEAFSNIFNARSILDGVSLSNKDSIGNIISSPLLTINDNGLHKSNIGAFAFDGEGTPTKDLCIIRDGILESFLHSEATARKFGVLPTGHAGLGAKGSVSPEWLVVKRSENSSSNYEHLNHKEYKGNYVLIESLNALHAGVKASQGSFSLPFDGWLVENGELISIESATVAGDIKDLLKNIINIEKEQIITHSGISPYIWIESLSITGEE